MQSNGGLASADVRRGSCPAHIIESGPAAGVVGAPPWRDGWTSRGSLRSTWAEPPPRPDWSRTARCCATEAIEVGGGVMAGSRLLVGAGYMLKLPAIDLAEVGAGGGSICRLDSAGRAEGRTGERGRRAGTGLLRSRRHCADDHRLQPGAGLPRSRRTDRRHHAAGPGGGTRAAIEPGSGGPLGLLDRGSGAWHVAPRPPPR